MHPRQSTRAPHAHARAHARTQAAPVHVDEVGVRVCKLKVAAHHEQHVVALRTTRAATQRHSHTALVRGAAPRTAALGRQAPAPLHCRPRLAPRQLPAPVFAASTQPRTCSSRPYSCAAATNALTRCGTLYSGLAGSSCRHGARQRRFVARARAHRGLAASARCASARCSLTGAASQLARSAGMAAARTCVQGRALTTMGGSCDPQSKLKPAGGP